MICRCVNTKTNKHITVTTTKLNLPKNGSFGIFSVFILYSHLGIL